MTSPPHKSAMKPTKNSRRVRISSPTPSQDDYRSSTPTPTPPSPKPSLADSDKHREPVKQAEAPPAAPPSASVPTHPPYNSIASVTAGPNHLFTHTTQPVGVPPAFFQPNFPGQQFSPSPLAFGAAPSPFVTNANIASGLAFAPTQPQIHPLPITAPASGAMAYYQNAFQPNPGASFQPQVPDTSGGPMTHTYVPRHDNFTGYFVGQQQPGIIVGPQPCPYNPYQSIRPCYIYQPAVAPSYCSYRYASVSFLMPLGFHGETHIIAPSYGPVNTVQYQNGIPVAPAVGPVIPLVNQQPAPQPTPLMMPGGPFPVVGTQGGPAMMGPPPGLVIGGQPQMMPGNMNPNGVHVEPAVGLGLTGMEVAADQAQNTQICEPQDFKPADDDPSRMYFVRQVDNCWTVLSRAAIDGVGDCRWYQDDFGRFYAVRLPS